MMTEETHRLLRRIAHRGQAEALDEAAHDPFRRIAGADDAGGQAERPGGSRNEPAVGLALVFAPAAFLELVLDQLVLRQRIGNPQQRFGENHECQTFARRKPVFAQEILDAAHRAGIVADRLDHVAGALVDRLVLGGAELQPFAECMQQAVVVTGKWSVEQGISPWQSANS